jgi:phosphoribosylformylglycinamidine synthase
MMPHPERVCDPLLGSTDGLGIFQSLVNTVAGARATSLAAAHST